MSVTRVVNNIAAINANRNLTKTGFQLQKSIERLSSGLRINRAADDAAGLTVASRLKAQFSGINQAIANAQDGINLMNVAEGGLEEITTRLNRMRVLAIQAGNIGVNDIRARQAIQDEISQNIDEINRIANTTQFNTNYLLNGDFGIESALVDGQDYVGVRIDQSPVASTLQSGRSYLNLIQTEVGLKQIVTGEQEGEVQTLSIGIREQTDIAVSLGHWTTAVTIDSPNAVSGTALASAFFQGVSLHTGDTVVFSGVLSDGVHRFAGQISVGTRTIGNLLTSINNAIVNATEAFWGLDISDVPDSYKITAVLGTGANAGRIVLRNTTQTYSQASIDITINATRAGGGGELVAQSIGVTRGAIGAASILSGSGQIGNSVTAITGSTFDTGSFTITVEDVVSARQRTTEGTIVFRDANGALLSRTASLGSVSTAAVINGSFVNGVYTGGYTLFHNSTITLVGTEMDGSTFQGIYTLDTTLSATADTTFNDFLFATLSGLVEELNYRTRSYSGTLSTSTDGDITRFSQSQFTFSNSATIQLVDDIGKSDSQTTFTMTFLQDTTNHVTIQDDAVLKWEGFEESATFSINGGEPVRAKAGEVVTLYGPESTVAGVPTAQLTVRIGSGLTPGSDVYEVRAQEYVGTLNGGPAVTFQNGDQDVTFFDGQSGTTGVARYLTVDFDAILDVTKTPTGQSDRGTTVIISTVNKSINYHVGAFADQRFQNAIGDLRSDNLGFGRGSGRTLQDIDITTVEGVDDALEIIDEALDQINRTRSLLGAATNRLEATVSNLSVTSENLTASYSRLRDVDIAQESSEFTKNQILLQAGTSVLAQANFMQQGFLALLG